MFRPNTVGASTLAAMSVPEDELESVAEIVNSFGAVNHNYEREHDFNLWFVATEADLQTLQESLDMISAATGYDVMSLPMVKAFHIDLGFDLGFAHKSPETPASHKRTIAAGPVAVYEQTPFDEKVVSAIQSGLPVCSRPYRAIADNAGITEAELIRAISRLQECGTIKRWGMVVRHHELGYRANAMVVWDVPGDRLERVAAGLAKERCVTLCYQRPRCLPHWPYNLFCMIHGKDRQQVLDKISDLVNKQNLTDINHDVLFSRRRFKQRGARYRTPLPVAEPSLELAHG